MQYRITVDGNVSDRVSDAFPHLQTVCRGPYYVITGDLRDQAQLHGVLALVRDLNVPLISLESLDPPTGVHEAGDDGSLQS